MMAQPAQLLYTLDDLAEASRWALQEIFPDPGYTFVGHKVIFLKL
jgi:hypothetical protein